MVLPPLPRVAHHIMEACEQGVKGIGLKGRVRGGGSKLHPLVRGHPWRHTPELNQGLLKKCVSILCMEGGTRSQHLRNPTFLRGLQLRDRALAAVGQLEVEAVRWGIFSAQLQRDLSACMPSCGMRAKEVAG